jgi:hypothetical protein
MIIMYDNLCMKFGISNSFTINKNRSFHYTSNKPKEKYFSSYKILMPAVTWKNVVENRILGFIYFGKKEISLKLQHLYYDPTTEIGIKISNKQNSCALNADNGREELNKKGILI